VTAPFGFDSLSGNQASVVLEGNNHVLEVRFSSKPGTFLRKILSNSNAPYELSYRFKVKDVQCQYATLGGMFFTQGPNDTGGLIAGPTMCAAGNQLAGSHDGCSVKTVPLTRGKWQDARIRPSQGTTSRSVEVSIGQDDLPRVQVEGRGSVISLTLGFQYSGNICSNAVVNYDDIVLRKL
jgi:hypothetical protein